MPELRLGQFVHAGTYRMDRAATEWNFGFISNFDLDQRGGMVRTFDPPMWQVYRHYRDGELHRAQLSFAGPVCIEGDHAHRRFW